ncbi:Hypothetical predicted protein [Mytilus galloprovincialis]|uniref:PHD-type domain-containing protein n=1 Tax=Mytilus galloprovincialis TaxID=29158 RepID=A0A8B6ECV0_MYTGA|nr:Hypothetical predicted protein [Mytilus galloprovincialis]
MALSSNPVLVLQIILIIQVVRYNAQIAEHHAPDQTNNISLLHKDNCHPYTGIFHWCRVNKIHRYPIKFSENYNSSLYRTILLVIAGIELNPGPRQLKYPCGTCTKACKWGEKALACDECDTWYHATCAGINTQEYSKLANTSVSWYCMVCNAPNHTTVLYDLIDSADSNTFSMLSISDGNKSSSINQDDSNISLGDPLAASSPKRTSYSLHGHRLETIDSGKYLGLTISKDLTWSNHINQTIGKASKTLGFLRRNLDFPGLLLLAREEWPPVCLRCARVNYTFIEFDS